MPLIKYLPKLWLVLLLSSCTIEGISTDGEISGKVVAVKDGDTVEVFSNEKHLLIRLAHIDCPELRTGQPFSKTAKKFTSDHCFGQNVKIIHEGKYDKYGRLIAVIINKNNENINKELIKAGLAWHFKKYSSVSEYARLEETARQNRIGLWSEKDPTPPWKWRN